MSLPTFPPITPVSLEEALSMILASIAMEELGLSHIINAESEKLQYVLSSLSKCHSDNIPFKDILAVNESIKKLLDSILQNQIILKSKMECALEALIDNNNCPIGPTGCTGATGPTGPAGSCCIGRTICFLGNPQRWCENKQLKWQHSNCFDNWLSHLSSSGNRIILENGSNYMISFSLDLCDACGGSDCVSFSVQTRDSYKKVDRFIYNVPVGCKDSSFMASGSGIAIKTNNDCLSTELMLTLLSPDYIKVKQASICIMEI